MSRSVGYFLGGLTTLLALLALGWLAAPAAASPLAVDLLRFELRAVADGVEIEWETATETDVAYFKIKRGPEPNGPFADLPEIGLVPAEGSTFSGAIYTEVDRTAVSGQTYRYQLYEVNLSNAEQLVAFATISLGPTATPEIIGGGDPGMTSTPAPTSTMPGAGGGTPTPATTVTAGSGTAAPALTATVTVTGGAELGDAEGTTPATVAARPLGPTPTRFSFTPSAPGGGGATGLTNPPVAQAAGPDDDFLEEFAEATPAAEIAIAPLPAVGDSGVVTQAGQNPVTLSEGGLPDSLPDSVGRGQGSSQSPQADDEAAAPAQETSSAARLLLWFGFIGGLFIFIAGIAISIILSTRRRDGGPLQ